MPPKKSAVSRRKKKGPKVRVRMYRQGLGDCFLVTFHTGTRPVHMQIDCGTLGSKNDVTMAQVVDDIGNTTGNHLDLLVVTHEHRDHVSGFGSERERWEQIEVDNVWVAWTEDGKDELARKVEKYKGDVLSSVALTTQALAGARAATPEERQALDATHAGIRELLAFMGDVPDDGPVLGATLATSVQEAMTYATRKAGDAVRFLSPGVVLEPEWLPGVRFYVLGPPRDEAKLKKLGDHGSPELYGLAGALASGISFGAAGKPYSEYRAGLGVDEAAELERGLPFDPRFRVESADQKACGKRFTAYYDPKSQWRRIDADWLNGASDLALQLDSLTNNTSLALAVELIEDGRVLLFAADAQVGNWLSWHDYTWKVKDPGGSEREVKAADLLARAVFYKVGHHCSHNATINDKGLELMRSPHLTAAIPLDHEVALNKKWTMPAEALYKRLLEKTFGRVLRSDSGWPKDGDRPASVTKEEWDHAIQEARAWIDEQPLHIDFTVS
ncbi:MAG TPA: hypothetical protein VF771_02190 [Longimicrobiaceae bacterium]